MPILVNGETISPELIREEVRRLAQLPEWQEGPDDLEKRVRMRVAAEWFAIDRVLLRQAAEKDPRPIDGALVAAQVARLSAAQSCRVLFDDGPLARQIEAQLRLERTMRDLMGPVPRPTGAEIARLYKTQRPSFQRPETVHAAQIIKHVDETHPEPEARAAIEAAWAALERGEPFAEVADRYSDCQGNGGDLGIFPRGEMVEEFERVVFALRAGERSSIFRTPFGFHIAEVRAKTPAGMAELREVQENIGAYLTSLREQEAAQRAVERLRAAAQIRRTSAREAR